MIAESCIFNSVEPELPDRYKKLLESCGIYASEVEPKPIGGGGNHEVYIFVDKKKVVKVPINQHIGTVGSGDEERLNIDLYQRYFPNFSIPTFFVGSSLGYCVVMDFVNGRVVTKDDVFEMSVCGVKQLSSIGKQLEEIIENNRRLITDEGRMLDLVGLEGLISTISAFLPGGRPAGLTNLLVEGERLRIVDYDMISLNPKTPFEKLKFAFVLQLNQQALSYHFNMNYFDPEVGDRAP